MKIISELMSNLLKATVVAMLIAAAVMGITTYNKYSHTGPDCLVENFNYWLKSGKAEGEIVSMYEHKLQIQNGKTKCYGTFKTAAGEYEPWSGWTETLTSGIRIGNASLD